MDRIENKEVADQLLRKRAALIKDAEELTQEEKTEVLQYIQQLALRRKERG